MNGSDAILASRRLDGHGADTLSQTHTNEPCGCSCCCSDLSRRCHGSAGLLPLSIILLVFLLIQLLR